PQRGVIAARPKITEVEFPIGPRARKSERLRETTAVRAEDFAKWLVVHPSRVRPIIPGHGLKATDLIIRKIVGLSSSGDEVRVDLGYAFTVQVNVFAGFIPRLLIKGIDEGCRPSARAVRDRAADPLAVRTVEILNLHTRGGVVDRH